MYKMTIITIVIMIIYLYCADKAYRVQI